MSKLKLARLGHPKIRSGAQPVSPGELRSAETQRLIEDMIETMRDADGVGIAAPQVHVAKQIAVVEVTGNNPRYPNQSPIPLTVLVNPQIMAQSEDTEDGWEGCLSVPDLRGRVPRWRTISVTALDRDGTAIGFEASGFFARVIQHEVDHLNGYVFMDRLPDLRTLTHLREYEKYWANRVR